MITTSRHREGQITADITTRQRMPPNYARNRNRVRPAVGHHRTRPGSDGQISLPSWRTPTTGREDPSVPMRGGPCWPHAATYSSTTPRSVWLA